MGSEFNEQTVGGAAEIQRRNAEDQHAMDRFERYGKLEISGH